MNVLRNQWSVSGQTVAVMQLSGSDEMGRIERGVFFQVGRDTSRVHSTRQHRCLVEYAQARTGSQWRCRSSGLASARPLALWTALHCFVLFVTCQQ